MNDLKEFITASQIIGNKTPYWTQGAGGNISVKIDDELLVKASGYRLKEISEDHGWVKISLKQFKDDFSELEKVFISEAQYNDLLNRHSTSHRPSMETGFHVTLPFKWVAHFHSLASILMTDKKYGFENSKFEKIGIMLPGFELAKHLKKYGKTKNIFLLQNHGAILCSDSPFFTDSDEPTGIMREWIQVENEFLKKVESVPVPFDNSPIPLKYYFPDAAVLSQRLLNILSHENGKYRVNSNSEQDKDALEIWQATHWLYKANPNLSELPAEYVRTVNQLPTEKLRQQGVQL